MNADATEVMKNIGVNDVTGDMQMQQLDFQTRKLVEIAKVVMKQPQILVIDETSTALSHDGRQVLYDIMNRFRKENKSVIFISHDLDEIMDVCDTLTVLRDGKIIRTFVKEEFEAGAIRASMIGRELQGDYYRSDFKATSQPQVALDVKNLIYGDRLKDISFQVKKGEIVGIGGLAHCGMHSLGKVCFGALKPESGSVSVSDGTIIDSPSKAMKKRLGYVSKDRDVESLCLNASIEDNISIAGMSEFAIKDFLVLKNREKKYVDNQIKEFRYLKNIMGLWMIQSVRKEIVPDMSFGQICELASKEPIKSIVDVNDNRFLAPLNMTEEVKRACAESGQQVPDSIAQIAAVIYNSLAECYASTVKEIEGLTHKNYEYIHIVGGGANAGYLNELTANETRKTVYAGPTEATAIGNIASQMIADGKLKDLKDARRCIFDSFEIKEYNPDL